MDTGSVSVASREAPAKVVVIGNSKGGTGKSTVAVHLAIALLYKGYEVGVLDLDTDQGTMTRYLANRRSWRSLDPLMVTKSVRQFPMPRQAELAAPGAHSLLGEDVAARPAVGRALAELGDCDFVIVDTPGSPSALARAGHERADILVTPINDSFVDIDVLADIDMASRTVVAPSRYSRMARAIDSRRREAGRPALDWLVLRNRLPHIYSHNRRDIDQLMVKLSERLGFREASGIGERVAFREHFQTGLTALDLVTMADDRTGRPALLAAGNEISALTGLIVREPRTAPPLDIVGA